MENELNYNNENVVERYNRRNKRLKRLYNYLMLPEVLKILANYGITTISGVASVAMYLTAFNFNPDLYPEDVTKKIIGALIISGVATGIFSLEYFTSTKENRKERYEKIKALLNKKKDLYNICICNEEDLDIEELPLNICELESSVEEEQQTLSRK